MQIRLARKLCLGLAACLALDAFSKTARADFECKIYKANFILKNGARIRGFVTLNSSVAHGTGKQILDDLKSNARSYDLPVYRKLQKIRYPMGLGLAAARKDTVPVGTGDIRRIDYISSRNCLIGMEATGIPSLPQKAIDLLQRRPFALVETPTGDLQSEVCLSYNRQVGRAELRRVCGKIKKWNPQLTDRENEARKTRRFDGLFERNIIAIQLQGVT